MNCFQGLLAADSTESNSEKHRWCFIHKLLNCAEQFYTIIVL